jgi:predicted amidohydrolase
MDYNLGKMERTLIEETKVGKRADLYLFPELSIIGGYFPGGIQANADNYRKLAEVVPDGPSCRRVARLAQQYCTHLCAGLVERDGSRYFISHVLYGPDGFVIHQRKLLPQNPTHPVVFSSGQDLHAAALLGHRCVILACADWLEAETTVLAGLEEVSLILAPTGGFRDEPYLRKLISAKALWTDSCIAATFGHCQAAGPHNIVGVVIGPDGEEHFSGSAAVNEDAAFAVEIVPRPPEKRWGGFKARAPLLARALRSYLPDISENEETELFVPPGAGKSGSR